MGKKVETDYYKFVENGMALHLADDSLVPQTKLIKALSSEHVKNGKKLESTFDCCDQIYMFDCGEEIIKIGVDRKLLENGDANALAVDGMCQNAIRVRNVNIRNKVIAGGLTVVFMVLTALGFRYAAKKEAEIQKNEDSKYVQYINEQRNANGVPQMLPDGSTLDYTDYANVSNRSMGGR